MVKKLDVQLLRYITSEHFRVVTAVEMGMKNHEIVPQDVVCSISNLKHGGVHKLIKDLIRWRLIATERKGMVFVLCGLALNIQVMSSILRNN